MVYCHSIIEGKGKIIMPIIFPPRKNQKVLLFNCQGKRGMIS